MPRRSDSPHTKTTKEPTVSETDTGVSKANSLEVVPSGSRFELGPLSTTRCGKWTELERKGVADLTHPLEMSSAAGSRTLGRLVRAFYNDRPKYG